MSPFYTFSPNSTSISFPWPASVTGVERVMLSAQGNLQKFLSAFFARPIHVTLVYSHDFSTASTSGQRIPTQTPDVASASRATPAIQTRQVYLECNDKVVCICTSTVTLSNPHVAGLFLVDKYPIGQTFSKLGQTANFELLEVGFGEPPQEGSSQKELTLEDSKPTDNSALWRKYRLFVEDFECEILEVFPSRQMFSYGESWLTDSLPSTFVGQSRLPLLYAAFLLTCLLWIAFMIFHGYF
ncbi:hypothetical protein DL96DRAFT_1594392 [Flagelloscypha sp. PMI_526]|nr:hypothetical protein DL96DRAFT_1594392 [Flagelloscypha sp. PMI_526]